MSRDKLGNELVMRVQDTGAEHQSCRWDMSSVGEPRVKAHGDGSRRSCPLAPAPLILLRFYSGSAMQEGAVSFLGSLQFQALPRVAWPKAWCSGIP